MKSTNQLCPIAYTATCCFTLKAELNPQVNQIGLMSYVNTFYNAYTHSQLIIVKSHHTAGKIVEWKKIAARRNQ